ncbi:MAG: alpha/beta hydrolase [Verrucomicrobiota bacterium]
MVFVHGGMCERTFWRAQVDHFGERHRTVALDLAGHGASGQDRSLWSMKAFAEDVEAVILHLDLRDVVLIGHGMGAPVIIEAGCMMPERLAGLVGVDLFDLDQDPMSPEQLEQYLASLRADFTGTMRQTADMMVAPGAAPLLRQRIIATMSSGSPEVGVGAMEALFAHDLRPAMERLDVPLTLINSSDFETTNMDAARRHGVDVQCIENAGHFSMMERPDPFNRILDDLLSRWINHPTRQERT